MAKFGYEYTQLPDAQEPEFEQADDVFEGSGVPQRQTTDLRTGPTGNVADALVDVANQEMPILRDKHNNEQIIQGAIRAGQNEAMEDIRKRKDAADWIFGTDARAKGAAKIHAGEKVTKWFSDELAQINEFENMDPGEYQDRLHKHMTEAAELIEDRDVRAAFIDMGAQRLTTLVNSQINSNFDYHQKEAASAYRRDLVARSNVIVQQANTPHLQEQALADDKMRAEIAKMIAETKQIGVNTFLAPALAAAALMGGTAALVKLFF